MKKKEKKSKARLERELRPLRNLALRLCRKVVILRAGKKCQLPECNKKKRIHFHHIESYAVNKYLRYDPENGIALCSTHHKFGRESAHRSFVFMYELLTDHFPKKLAYLRRVCREKIEVDSGWLGDIIDALQKEVDSFSKSKKKQKLNR